MPDCRDQTLCPLGSKHGVEQRSTFRLDFRGRHPVLSRPAYVDHVLAELNAIPGGDFNETCATRPGRSQRWIFDDGNPTLHVKHRTLRHPFVRVRCRECQSAVHQADRQYVLEIDVGHVAVIHRPLAGHSHDKRFHVLGSEFVAIDEDVERFGGSLNG